jgi:hypothetical protein
MKKRQMLHSGAAGAVTEIVELGGSRGELARISEPGSGFNLTYGVWKNQYCHISSEITPLPGTYVMVTPLRNGHHLTYIGESGSVVGRIGWHDFALNHPVAWFAVLACNDLAWTKAHALALQSRIHTWFSGGLGVTIHGRKPSQAREGIRDGFMGTLALQFVRRAMAYSTLPETIRLPDENGVVHAPVVSLEHGPALQIYETFAFRPGPNCAYAGLHATLSDTSAGFVLHAGSELRCDTSKGLHASIHNARRHLWKMNVLQPVPGTPGRVRTTVPIAVSTPLVAAKIIAGYPIPGLPVWEAIPTHPLTIRGG